MTQARDKVLRFGVLGTDDGDVADQAREAEALGYDIYALSDHLHSSRPTLEPWTALTWAAAATENIAVLSDVIGLPYREPPVLAKMAETLARLSGGRLILGLGNGGYDAEFRAFGLATRSPGEKVAALGEAVQVLRALWTGSETSFAGVHYRLDAARIAPPPTHPVPIWIGAYGPRSLAQTGAIADGWLPSMQRLDLEQAAAMRAAVVDGARAAGRDPDAMVNACNVQVHFDERRSPTPQLVAGSVEQIAQQLHAIAGCGFDTFVVAGLRRGRDRERFAREVVPLVRAAARSEGLIANA
ncbi:LLM class flavin-dependent oxidoreductase [Solicola gregarius]|uniref:LLM class flavin-dependent oxidoreductase n=1 Tax=Solicola gregarius TaxID=2908642 RepID=A0AA46TLC0_9ACTN|nr:LLM class flavin-dependent oxidoreductase [Solicola gregarius]UYM07419.1 LLM class flavin-dependent oxidoreductase [Solicola gregarius]